jgi:hypothetical protein
MTIINNNQVDVHYNISEGFDLIDEVHVSKKVLVVKKSAKIIEIK